MVTFFVGQRYRNRKGEYEVLQFQGDSMKVRYDDGSQQILSIATQSTIFENMQREEMLTKSSKKPSTKPQNQQF